MSAYRLTLPAEDDVLGIWFHIAKDNLAAADRFVDRLTEAFQLLADNPEMGERMERYRLGLRAWSLGNYIIYFHATVEGIEVYRVLHGARDQGRLL
jgi:toxin ParE1/3/4